MRADSDSEVMFRTVAIVGVGLIGGSLGMAAKRRSLAGRIIGLGRSEQKLMRAKILGAIDEYSLDIERGATDADLVVICTPVTLIVPVLQQMAAGLKEGAVITDVGSTKREIVQKASAAAPDGRYFVGGHPMAGSEQTGVEAAIPDLFLGATYVLTPDENTDLTALGRLTAFVEAIGANVEVMSPERHDAAAAVISHLPHAMAGALLKTAEDAQREIGSVYRLAAGSFRDLTRISDSSPEIWRDICSTNADALAEAVDAFIAQLKEFRSGLADRDANAMENFFRQAREIRNAYLRIAK